MEEAKAMAAQQQQQQQQQQHQQQQQQQQLIQQQNQQQQQRQQYMLLQQFQKQQQASAISRFPSNIDAHLRPPGLPHRPGSINLLQNPNPNPPNTHTSFHPNPNSTQPPSQQQPQQPQPQPQPQQRPVRPGNQAELQMAYQDAWRVCHPDFKRPFTSLEDACERLLPYHVVADYEAEEDDRILDSDPTGQILSRSQQWDHNIAAKVAEFTATFEKQALAFNLISRKRALGEFRSEERLMIEQALLQEEKRAILELKAEMDKREKAGREAHEAKMRLVAMAAQAEQAQSNPNARAEMMIRTPIRARALGTQGSEVPLRHNLSEHEQFHPDELPNGWGTNAQRDEKDPSDDLLNDEETANGEAGIQDSWREVGEFDLNSR